MIKVTFEGGSSRANNRGCNYMIADVDDGIELYAECEEPEEWIGKDVDEISPEDLNRFDDESFDVLKEEIIRQAKENGVDVNSLQF